MHTNAEMLTFPSFKAVGSEEKRLSGLSSRIFWKCHMTPPCADEIGNLGQTSRSTTLFLHFSFLFALVHQFMAPTFLLEILPEADAIKIFNGPNVIPSETYVLRGYVQLTTARRVGIRQISIQLEGVVRNMISAYPAEPAFDTQINPELWPASVYHANEDMPLLDRVMRRALLAAAGYASSKEIITRETTELFGDGMTTLMVGAGVIRWPFEITIPNAHKLPPSILLPQHSIHYALSAQLKLASIRDSLLVSFWNASFFFPGTASSRTNGSSRRPRRRRRLSHVSASSSTASSSSSSSDTSPAAHWDAEIMLRKSQKKKRQQMCRAYRPIQVRCHGYPSLQVLDQQPWIRYRGCRTGRLRYEVFMPRAVCLQQKTIDVICHFTPLCAETQIESIHMVLEQVSRFP